MKHSRPLSIVSPIDQPSTFVELFFDLVFVFSVTQVVHLVSHDLRWATVGEAVLVFWLVWWAWTQFTWALNAANTEHPVVELTTLAATGVAFLMAVTVPEAFHGRALWFAVPYVLVRVLGLALYAVVARANNPLQHAAVRTFSLVSLGGLVSALAGAFLGGPAQYALWGLTIALDVAAAAIGGRAADWDIHPEHFVERHGLFVIIALGECLIVAAAGLTEAEWTGALTSVAVLAVATTCVLWWSYFAEAKPALEHGLAAVPTERRAAVSRDAFSLFHFPVLLGIIAFSIGVEVAAAHPADPFPIAGRLALGLSLVLFMTGTALAVRRTLGRTLVLRPAVSAVAATLLVFVGDVPAALALGVVLAGALAVAVLERWPATPAPPGNR